ncbi:DUF2726 domain-containing protein [Veronia nyctiphanis]|nr:DUF2726 domain-containing protein [Veronia nyctiphanis]
MAMFTRPESAFLTLLELAITQQYRVFAKVRVGNVVTSYRASSKVASELANELLSANHFDFILCNKYDLSVVAAITLEATQDRSKKKSNEQKTKLIENICKQAKIPHVMFRSSVKYTPLEIANTLRRKRIKIEQVVEETKQPKWRKPSRLARQT